MKNGIIDIVFRANFRSRILNEKKNVDLEIQNEILLSNFKNSHYKPLISNLCSFLIVNQII